MKAKLTGTLVALAFLCLQAQADTFLSSMGNAPQSESEVYDDGVVYEQWGIPFITGTSDYSLDAVTLMLRQDNGTSKLTLSLYAADGSYLPTGAPISIDFISGVIPTSDFGPVTFTPGTSIILDTATAYVFVLSTAPGGDYAWRNTTDTLDTAIGGWSFPQPYVMAHITTEFGPPTWGNGGGGNYHFMGAIEATPVPEPTTLALGALGLAVLGLRRSRRASAE